MQTQSLSTMRLYGSAISIVSGLYSVYLATTGSAMTTATWAMLALGIVVLGHGIALLTPLARTLGTASGPLMVAYSVAMLANQGWMATMDRTGTMADGTMNGMTTSDGMATATMGTDAGMVAIAVLMLFSGLLMTVRREMMPSS